MSAESHSSGTTVAPTATEIARLVRSGELTALKATEAALERIANRDRQIAAFCTLAAEQALETAADLDRRMAAGEDTGPMTGVPVAIKDLIPTKDLRTTFGSALTRDYVPAEDDVSVARLRQAGAVIVGKTNTSEFGYGPVSNNRLFPPTRNPWNTSLTPGGSSAGSAAAVAAGMIPVALGSDGGGSIRVPAALCGVFGLKPSWGRVPIYPSCRDERFPGVSSWESLEHIGPITASVADAARVMSVIAGHDHRDRHSIPAGDCVWAGVDANLPPGERLAYSPDLGFAAVDGDVEETVRAAVHAIEAAGCVIERATPRIDDPQAAFEAIVALDTDRDGLARLAREKGIVFGSALAAVIERRWSTEEFADALLMRKQVSRVMAAFLAEYRFLLTPTTATAAYAIDIDAPSMIGGSPAGPSAWTPFSTIANLAGLPSATVPAGFTAGGLPVGLQITGRHLDDVGVLKVAAFFEALRPWPRQADQSSQLPAGGVPA